MQNWNTCYTFHILNVDFNKTQPHQFKYTFNAQYIGCNAGDVVLNHYVILEWTTRLDTSSGTLFVRD